MTSEAKPKQRLGTTTHVAAMIDVAPETVRRTTDRGAMPKPVRIGRAVRYCLDEIEQWISDGCPDWIAEG